MKNKYSKLLQVAAVGAIALAAAPSAQALATIRISDGVNTTTISDGSLAPLDGDAALGGVSFVGTLGTTWNFIITAGTSKPLFGSAASPDMHFTISARSNGAGTLTLQFADDNFGPTTGSLSAGIGGALGSGASLTYQTLVSTSNTEFAGVALTSLQSFSPISFSGTVNSAPQTLGAGYALTQKIVLTHTGAETSSADAVLHSVPDGGLTISLLGGAMVGLAGLRRKLRSA